MQKRFWRFKSKEFEGEKQTGGAVRAYASPTDEWAISLERPLAANIFLLLFTGFWHKQGDLRGTLRIE
jgi:hypothetical protein